MEQLLLALDTYSKGPNAFYRRLYLADLIQIESQVYSKLPNQVQINYQKEKRKVIEAVYKSTSDPWEKSELQIYLVDYSTIKPTDPGTKVINPDDPYAVGMVGSLTAEQERQIQEM